MSFIELAVVNLNNIRHNHQLEESSENVSPEVVAESLHDPKNFDTSKNEFGES
jgi:hypothetical protein